MAPLVDEKAPEDFLDQADLDEARRAEAALEAMAASVRLSVGPTRLTRNGNDTAGTVVS
jgi:hypothetical protein